MAGMPLAKALVAFADSLRYQLVNIDEGVTELCRLGADSFVCGDRDIEVLMDANGLVNNAVGALDSLHSLLCCYAGIEAPGE